jgi:hypothetical protein
MNTFDWVLVFIVGGAALIALFGVGFLWLFGQMMSDR